MQVKLLVVKSASPYRFTIATEGAAQAGLNLTINFETDRALADINWAFDTAGRIVNRGS